MINRRFKNKGFSLVELSISLAVIGMIASSALSVAVSSDYYTKKSETEAKLNRIEEAIGGFLQSNLRLPCPADGTLAITNANFGLEGTPTSADCPNKNFTSGNIRAGVVPVRSLALPDDFMFDGWGRRITYVVDVRLANNTTTNAACASSICFYAAGGGSIVVNDASGTARASTAVYLLLSHGENGHGAYPKNGGTTRINAFPAGVPYRADSPGEMENAELDNAGADTAYDATFVMKDYIREDDTTDANREYFDDIVRYRLKARAIDDAGEILYSQVCVDAKAIIDTPGTNSCSNAYSEGKCESFAAEIYDRCLK